VEERKNLHINDLIGKHKRAFEEIKNYYNDITHNNLDLIRTLKEDVAKCKQEEAKNQKLMFDIAKVGRLGGLRMGPLADRLTAEQRAGLLCAVCRLRGPACEQAMVCAIYIIDSSRGCCVC
jgi:hypothetical protein